MRRPTTILASMAAAIIMAISLAACSQPSGPAPGPQEASAPASQDAVAESAPQKPGTEAMKADDQFEYEDYTDDAALDEILNAIVHETQRTTDDLQAKLDAFLEACGDSYEGYQANKQQLADWYAAALQSSTELYAFMQSQCDAYHQLLLTDDAYREYKVWNDALSESYGVWNDALSDYYGDWNDMFSDIYDECTDMIGRASKTVGYDEYQDAWDEMYDARQDAWDDMYDLRQDAWDELYDARQDTWDELYSRR